MDNLINSNTFYSFHISYGTLMATYKEDIPSLVENIDSNIELNIHMQSNKGSVAFYGCFDPFWGVTLKKDFYFVYPLLPVWYADIIKEFNSTFKNIKIEIEHESPPIFGYVTEYMGQKLVNCRWSPAPERENITFMRGLFSIELSPEYKDSVRRKLIYFIHHLFRMMSYSEMHYIHLSDKNPEKNYLQSLVDYNNRNTPGRTSRSHDQEYRGLSIRNNVTLQNILNADIPLLVNIAFNHHNMNVEKQTNLQEDLDISEGQTNDPKRSERLRKLDPTKTYYTGIKNNKYGITTEYALMEMVRKHPYSSDGIVVRVLDHLKNDSAVGSTHDVNSSQFRTITLEEWSKLTIDSRPTIYYKYMQALKSLEEKGK